MRAQADSFNFGFKATFLLLMLSLSACKNQNLAPLAAANCETGKVQLEFFDGAWVRACGCAEANQTTFNSGQNLTCTVNAGTVIFLNFISISQSHQLHFETFGTFPIIGAKPSSPVQTLGFPANQSGTFQFHDVFFPSFTGTLVVL
jgi:hypothetical protein